MTTEAVDLLRQHGIQVTAQRLAILRAVSANPHTTADGVTESVRSEIGTISRQSVYDGLETLVGVGLIRRIEPAGSPARFENRVADNHHHLICRTCGEVVDVDCAIDAVPCLTASDDRGYAIDEAEVTYWGQCPQCVALRKATTDHTATRQMQPAQSKLSGANKSPGKSASRRDSIS